MRSARILSLAVTLGLAHAGCSESSSSPDRSLPDLSTPDAPRPDSLLPDLGRPDLGPYTPMTWKTIAAGKFTMGSPTDETCRESNPAGGKETEHEVTLSRAFKITATETTRGQFWALMGYDPAEASDPAGSRACGVDCPAHVTWAEASAFCAKLSTKEGLAPCTQSAGSGKTCKTHLDCQPRTTQEACVRGTCTLYKAVAPYDCATKKIHECPGYRLPTEAEWEYAYRAGSTTALHNGPLSAGSCNSTRSDANADLIAWYDANSGGTVHRAAQKQPNAWGLYDMAGNAAEWCDGAGEKDLGSTAAIDPCGSSPSYPSYRAVRGGSATYFVAYLRAAVRGNTNLEELLGFRCVISQ